MNLFRLCTTSVEVEREEADGNVECFARDFMTVHKRAPVSMDRYEAKR